MCEAYCGGYAKGAAMKQGYEEIRVVNLSYYYYYYEEF